MTPEQQRIAIAEWCGWRHEYDTKQLKAVWISPKSGYAYDTLNDMVPDYLNDLNAMHEVAMRLRIEKPLEYIHYAGNVTEIVAKWNSNLENHYSISAHDATAAQRAEALLRAIGKWENSEIKGGQP